MKHNLAVWGMFGMAALALTSFTTDQKADQNQEPQKKRHIKLTKVENGKTTVLDTLVAGDGTFVWHGDTLGGEAMTRHINRSMGERMKHIRKIKHAGDTSDEKVMIIHQKGGKDGEPMIWNMDSAEDLEIITEDVDSLGKRIVVRARNQGENPDHMMFFDGPGHLPVHPVPHIQMLQRKHENIIDLSDRNIISYRKKDMRGNREKIEIIRKKAKGLEHEAFGDLEHMGHMMPPPPPVPPHLPEIPEFNEEIQKEHATEIQKAEPETK